MSLNDILNSRLDLVAFLVLCVGAMTAVQFWLRRVQHVRLPRLAWFVLLGLVAAGSLAADRSGDRERERLRQTLVGIAPTYAAELQRLGHDRISVHTSPDDPTY